MKLYNTSNTAYIKLPGDLPTRDSYHVALIGSSGDSSDAFTIKGNFFADAVNDIKEAF